MYNKFFIILFTLLVVLNCKSNPYFFTRQAPKKEYSIAKLNEVIASRTELSNTQNGVQTIYSYWRFSGATKNTIKIIFEQHIGSPKDKADITEKRSIKTKNGNIDLDYYKLTLYRLSEKEMMYNLSDKLK